ncbi:hypothetical protein BC477_10850 [Clavibacter michiganensis subsp. michiganensis]|uniref:Uncharacterized protein n=1 Tax=Clavibacter michiganensis subsp. michiganensis TaxID=33013 RepID=A0A251XNZ2_CLAMM|nr:hypothetical protein BC477_10850 [Clavibacter michiganensis subsp. michiganensis]OUE05224.1 hypothetical protein CMMCAS07_09765 [Clavibacter michiganensis subsp. michiganensis]
MPATLRNAGRRRFPRAMYIRTPERVAGRPDPRRGDRAVRWSRTYGASRFGPRNRYVTSRRFDWCSSSMSTRLRPMPKPPCGGTP